MLQYAASYCARSPELTELWRALLAKPPQRFRNATTAYIASIHVACAAAFLEARAAIAPGADHASADTARTVAEQARALAQDLSATLTAAAPHLPPRAVARLAAFLQTLALTIGLAPTLDTDPLPAHPMPMDTTPLQPFPHASHMCIASLHAGWPLAEALTLWAHVHSGTFSKNGKSFYPGPRTPQQAPPDWTLCQVRSFPRAPGEAPICVYSLNGSIRAISSTRSLRIDRTTSSGPPHSLTDLPAFIALPRDEAGRPIIPKSRVTALVEAQDAWHCEFGSLDRITSVIVRGQLVMPKITTPSQCKILRNHPSWEDDPAAQAALGPIIAKWLAQGVLEYVQWDDRQPVLLQPCGAVPKGTAPFFRLITDARFGNGMYSDWGVNYTSAADLSAALHHRDFTWSSDLQDAYHLSVFAGCGGLLRPVKRPLVHGDGTVSWIDGFINGCDPSSCLGGCDKDMSGLRIHGHVFRFAACQFGQKTAGSPLNSVVMSVARYFGRLPNSIHVAAWVDDLHFSMRTPPHPPCLGFRGGCATCIATHAKAVAAEKLWHTKARACNLPLAPGKGHSANQGGAFTGVGIDTFTNQYTMLPEKLEGLHTNFHAMALASVSTPRALARTRGKANHYGCAVQYLRPACASLTQAMHQAETHGSIPPPDPTLEGSDPDFDWDLPIPTSTRTLAAIACLRFALHTFGTKGQPLWPTPPASLYGQFLASHPNDITTTVVLTVFALPTGWGFSLRTHPCSNPICGHGPWSAARGLLTASWMAPGPVLESGAPGGFAQRHALACLLSLHEASRRTDLSARPLLIRSASEEALTALGKGANHCPALQDISMLFQTACISLTIPQPAFLVTPAGLHARPPPSNAATLANMDSSAPRLRALVHTLASKGGHLITLDLFASTHNTITPRFYSQWSEPAAEATDALAQPDWSQSLCPCCKRSRADFVFLYPPFGLITPALRKARHDQAQGILVVPYASSAPWWPSILPSTPFHPPRISCCPKHVLNQSNSAGHYITAIHFDFWQGTSPRPPSCIHTHHRGASQGSSACDDSDIVKLTAALPTQT